MCRKSQSTRQHSSDLPTKRHLGHLVRWITRLRDKCTTKHSNVVLQICANDRKPHLIIYSVFLLFTFQIIIFIFFIINDFFIQIIFLIIIILFLTFYQNEREVSVTVLKQSLFPDNMLAAPTPVLREQWAGNHARACTRSASNKPRQLAASLISYAACQRREWGYPHSPYFSGKL